MIEMFCFLQVTAEMQANPCIVLDIVLTETSTDLGSIKIGVHERSFSVSPGIDPDC
jgi:hypothetical protein